MCTLTGHSDHVSRVQFSDDGAVVISGGGGTVRLSLYVWLRREGRVFGWCAPQPLFCVTRALTWLISQVRFWDVASGKEVRQVAGSEFAFVEGPAAKHKTNQHLLTARGDMLLITELLPHEGPQKDAAAMPVACFKAPQPITSVRCHGAAIFAGCSGGAVCLLQAPFLAA